MTAVAATATATVAAAATPSTGFILATRGELINWIGVCVVD